MKCISIVFCFLCITTKVTPQDSGPFPHFVFLPSGLVFAPLKADVQEPRVGVFKFLNAGEMKVDIGNTIDVFGLNFSHSRFTAGIDFFAYAYVTGAEGLRLQIDAVDGFFGGNLTYMSEPVEPPTDSTPVFPGTFFARLRILHHSAHFVDGHDAKPTSPPTAGLRSIPYTRDFGELTIAHCSSLRVVNTRVYGGISYATLARPDVLRRFAYLGGIEIARDVGAFFGQPSNLFVAYNASLTGADAMLLSNQVQLGIKFGTWFGKGPSLYLAYYAGQHFFGEYFNERLSTIGAGFTVDFQ